MKVVLLIFICLCSVARGNGTVLIINSYENEYEWTALQEKGFLEQFSSSSNEAVKRFYLHGKDKNEEITNKNIQDIHKYIQNNKISGVYLTDDLSMKHFYRYFSSNKIPLVFSGINGELSEYGKNLGKSVAGSLERYNFVPVIRIIQKVKPSIKNILHITDNNLTGDILEKSVMSNLEPVKKSGVKLQQFKSNSYEALKKILISQDPDTTAVIISAYYSYQDRNGKRVKYKKIDKWIRDNTRLIDVGVALFHSSRLLSLALSADENGRYAASELTGMMKGKKGEIRTYPPLQLTINKERSKYLNISFPYDILVYSKNNEFMTQNPIK